MERKNLVERLKIGVGATVLGITALAGGYSYFIPDKVTTQIVGTDIKRYDSSDKYLVNTTVGTFENTDAWYRFKFNSSDVQGEIKGLLGKTVEIEKYGWRIPFFSMYENIVEVKQIK